jgi:glucose dehydrogenase
VNRVRRLARSFGDFWWDFLVGDTPELFVAGIVIVVVALLLRHHSTVAVILLPALAIASLVASAWRGRGTG